MRLLTHRILPWLEARVARLPHRIHMADRGALGLLELASLTYPPVSTNSMLAGPPASPGTPGLTPVQTAAGPGTGLGSNQGSGQPGITCPTTVASPSVSISAPSSSAASSQPLPPPPPPPPPPLACLDLPGETPGRFRAVGPLPPGRLPASPVHQLGLAGALARLERVRCAPGSSRPARRIGLRASNGRLVYYDLGCLPVGSGQFVTAMAMLSANGSTCSTQAPPLCHILGPLLPSTLEANCPPAYMAWRRSRPQQLFQLLNDLLASQPETARRHLMLVSPRTMEVGPQGLSLVETGSSVSSSSFSAAASQPVPSACPMTSRGLLCLAQPPPAPSAISANSPAGALYPTNIQPPTRRTSEANHFSQLANDLFGPQRSPEESILACFAPHKQVV
ncbi:unnamed protein product [Protopolystoma xenopodis]|uniref:Uncharacterized protein n=1 Tax=Protopolystoma xenopodis TaxID=117903 RepID=A0A3S5B471_9PLAT|nr:unnamed protein product [Protopolystoma xenopodis]